MGDIVWPLCFFRTLLLWLALGWAVLTRGIFGDEEVMDAAFEKLQDTGEPEVVREHIAMRIMAAAKLGERDPAGLLPAALRGSD
jgi:hypothetical protein